MPSPQTTPIDPTAPVLAPTSDTGYSGSDGITKLAMPTFIGTAEPGWEIVLYDTNTHNGELGRTWSDPVTGEWSITLTTPLADGTYNNLKVEASDGVTHHALKSRAGPVVTIDTSAPLAPSAARLVTDSGQSATDGVTNVVKPSFTGTAAPGAIVTLYDGDIANGTAVPIGSVVTSALGVWTLAANSDLANGAHIITATTTDTAGNLGLTAALNIVIDAVAPTATIALSDSKLQIGETAEVTITFAERVFGFSNADLAIQNGTLSNVASSDGVTWTATFTPSANVTDTSNLITLANASVTDLAGNVNSGAASGNYEVDTARPTATIIMADKALQIGDTSQVTITFSEKVTGLTNADLVVENGTLSNVASSDGITWTAIFTPNADVTDASNLITLADASVADLAGNANSGATTSGNYAIDTARPTATITMTDKALQIGDTSQVTITFSEKVTGLTNADLVVENGTLTDVASSDGVTWTATFTPNAEVTSTTNLITLAEASVTDLAGNANSGTTTSGNYEIDTARPSATISMTDQALQIGDTSEVTITFSEKVTGLSNADLVVENGALTDVASSDGITWTAIFTPNADVTDASNLITLADASVTDLAGNANSGTTTSGNYEIDTARPSATISMTDQALQIGDTSQVTITFSEKVTGLTNADLVVENGTLSEVTSSDGVTWTATFTPNADVTDTSNLITLAEASVTDLAGNANSGAASANYEIDTARPTATITMTDRALQIGDTSQVTITFSEKVTGLSNADLVVENGALTDVASSDGITWTATFTPNADVTDASNLITLADASVVDSAGNANSGATTSGNYAIDTARPSATISMTDKALQIGDTSQVTITFSEKVTGLTNADLVVENGTLSEVTSSDGVTWTATFTPNADVTDAINLIALADASVVDAAGNANTGAASANYEIDTVRPTATITMTDRALQIGDTSQVTITFSEKVTGLSNADLVVENGTLTDVASSDGVTWTATFTPNADVTSTSNLITLADASVVDSAGNANSGATTSGNYAIDTARPSATISMTDKALQIGDTSQVTITFSEKVTGLTNADLVVENGTLSEVTSSDGVTWTATFTPNADVTDAINLIALADASVVDAAGNANTGAASANYEIDTVRPTATISMTDQALKFGDTSAVTITFSEKVTGLTNADLMVQNGTLSDVASSDGVTWTATFTPNADVTSTANLITLAEASVVDGAGNANSGAASANYEIDTARPSATISMTDQALQIGDTSRVTITFSEKVTGLTNADLVIQNGTLSEVASSDGVTWTATFTPSTDVTSTTNLITLADASVTDLAGNANSGATTSGNYEIDTVRPTATIIVADTLLENGESSLVTIAFSEQVTGFSNADLTIENGTLSAVASADQGRTWSAILTPSAYVTDPTNVITLANAGLADLAGNAGAGLATSNNYAIVADVVPPTATIKVESPSLLAGGVSPVTIQFSEAVTEFGNDDLIIENGTLSAVSSSNGGVTWTAFFTPAANVVDSTNVIRLANTGLKDLAGNAGVGTTTSNNYTIETTLPTATITMGKTALHIGDMSPVTITFSERVTNFSNADLTVENGTLSAVTSSDGAIWTATFTPAANVTDALNQITLVNSSVSDLAGNAGAGTTLSSNYAIDTIRPSATITVAAGSAALGGGRTAPVTIAFSESVTGLTNADLVVESGTLTAVTPNSDGTVWTATLTPNANVADLSNLITLVSGGVTDLAGNANSGSTASNNYAIDTVRPSATITMADRALWIGETSKVTITFLEKVTDLTASDFSVASGSLSTPVSADGITWTATFTPQAGINADTSNVITLNAGSVTDLAGNTNPASSSPNYTVDTYDSAAQARADTFLKSENPTVSISTSELLANDWDDNPGGTTAVVRSVSGAVGGTVSLSGTTVTFKAATNSLGNDVNFYGWGTSGFTYALDNGSTATVRVNFDPVGDYTYEQKIEKLYVAYFNRPAEIGGVEHWVGELKISMSKGNTFDEAYKVVSAGFAGSEEFNRTYSDIIGNNSAILTRIYQNLFDRTPEATAVSYWLPSVNDGTKTLGDLFANIAAGAQNSDLIVSTNKMLAAQYFTSHLNATENDNYNNGSNSFNVAHAYLDSVTSYSGPIDDALKGYAADKLYTALSHVDETIAQLIGV
jgi:hypothetical protein